jgi:hypothetical protein
MSEQPRIYLYEIMERKRGENKELAAEMCSCCRMQKSRGGTFCKGSVQVKTAAFDPQAIYPIWIAEIKCFRDTTETRTKNKFWTSEMKCTREARGWRGGSVSGTEEGGMRPPYIPQQCRRRQRRDEERRGDRASGLGF